MKITGPAVTAESLSSTFARAGALDHQVHIDCLSASPRRQNLWSTVAALRTDRWFMSERTSSNSAECWIEYPVALLSGDWDITLYHHLASSRPAYTFYIDGVSVGTVDGYGSGVAQTTLTNVRVADTGMHVLKLTTETKNASSAGYTASISRIVFSRKSGPNEFISVWGSSSPARLLLYGALESQLNNATHDGGYGGVKSANTLCRMGADNALVTVTGGEIPASGAVAVTTSSFPASSMNYTGVLAGVAGSLASDGSTFTFTRASAGSVVAVGADTPFYSSVRETWRWDTAVLWMGKNDLADAGGDTEALGNIAAASAFVGPDTPRFVVLGHFCLPSWTAGTDERTRCDAVNASLANTYGTRFLDVQAYLMSADVWTDTEITPDGTDAAAQAAGTLPPSLNAGDDIHLNAAAYTAVAAKVVTLLTSLGYVPTQPAI